MTYSKNKEKTEISFKKFIKSRKLKLKKFLKEYFIGKYRILFILVLFNILFLILQSLFPNIVFGIIALVLLITLIFTTFILSHFIFLNKKIDFKTSLKAFGFYLLNLFISFLAILFFLLITIIPFYDKLSYYLDLNNFTQQDILEMQKLNFYYTLFYPIFLVIVFLFLYIFTMSLYVSVYYYAKLGFKEGLKRFWKDFISKKNFFFFLFLLIFNSLFDQLSKLNQWSSLLEIPLFIPIIKYFHFIKESEDKRDFYLFLLLILILFIFDLLLLKL
jgi:hypothetical protein